MGVWRVGPDVLAGSRFALSPFAETVAALAVLGGRAEPAAGLEGWAREHRPAFRDRFAGDAFAAAFLGAAFRPRWTADFIARLPGPSFEQEVALVRSTPDEVARADLVTALGGPPPAVLDVPGVPDRAAGLLEWVWEHAVQPDWARRRRILEADIVARVHRLASQGWAAMVGGLRPGLRWLGDGRLQINVHDNPAREITDAELLFVPVTAAHGWVSWDHPHRYAVFYPCSGLLAGPGGVAVPRALGRLLGPTRADVLVRLAEPATTSQLAALTGCALGTVGDHLKVLLDAGLLVRRRSGRSVLYSRSPDGDRLVRSAATG